MSELLEKFKSLLKKREGIVHERSKLYKLKFDMRDADYQERYDKTKFQLRKFDDRERKINKLLDGLAKELPVQVSKNWKKYDSVWESTYSSQGFGSYKYAKERAEKIADDIKVNGVPVKIEIETKKFEGSGSIFSSRNSHSTFNIYVKADKVNREILKRKPGVTFREWIRLCWKRGVNPRVYNPFLPHGLEEKLEIDYFGNDLRKGEVK